MNIGIILYSETGNTYSVLQKLKKELVKNGHSVHMERLNLIGKAKPGTKDIKFETIPDIHAYDSLIFGSPVQSFSLSPAMANYLSRIKSLQDKKIALLVTQYLPFPWLGGNRTISQMKKICGLKGADICGTAIINWSKSGREKQIIEVIKKFSDLF